MPALVSLEMLDEELAAVVEAGNYDSERHALRDALEALLSADATLRTNTAIELYKRDQVTLARAAEIAGVHFEEFKDLLKAANVERIIDFSEEEMRQGEETLRSFLNKS